MRLYLPKLIKLFKSGSYKIRRIYCIKNKCRYILATHLNNIYDTQFVINIEAPYSIDCLDHSSKVNIKRTNENNKHKEYWSKLKGSVIDNPILLISNEISEITPNGECVTYSIVEDDDEEFEIEESKTDKNESIIEKTENTISHIRKKHSKIKHKRTVNVEFQDENGNEIVIDDNITKFLGENDVNEGLSLVDDIESTIDYGTVDYEPTDTLSNIDSELNKLENENSTNKLISCYRIFTLHTMYYEIDRVHVRSKRFNKKIKELETEYRQEEFDDIITKLSTIRKLFKKHNDKLIERIEHYSEKMVELEEAIKQILELEESKGMEMTPKELKKMYLLKDEARQKQSEYNSKKMTSLKKLTNTLQCTNLCVNKIMSFYVN